MDLTKLQMLFRFIWFYILILFRLCQQQEAELEARQKKEVVIPNSNYREKYEKLIGKDAGKTAAQVTKPNKQFGFGELAFHFYF